MLSKKYDDKPVFCRISLCKLLNIQNKSNFSILRSEDWSGIFLICYTYLQFFA